MGIARRSSSLLLGTKTSELHSNPYGTGSCFMNPEEYITDMGLKQPQRALQYSHPGRPARCRVLARLPIDVSQAQDVYEVA